VAFDNFSPSIGLPRCRRAENFLNLRESTRFCVSERGHAVAVCNGLVRARVNERSNGFDMIDAAVTEDDRLNQGGPTEIVDMIKRCAAFDEPPDDLVVTQMGGGDQGGAFITAGC